MNKFGSAKLSLTLYNKTASIEWDHNDLDLGELFDAFIGLLISQTFPKESIDIHLRDMVEELGQLNEL